MRDGLRNADELFSQQHISPASNEYQIINTKQFTKKILGCVSYYNRSIGNFPDVYFNNWSNVRYLKHWEILPE